MWWADPASESSSPASTLVRYLESIGVESAEAPDVAGSVLSFCRARHGTEHLPESYLIFLGLRAARLDPDAAACRMAEYIQTCPGDAEWLRALAAAADAPALFEAYRRRLVGTRASSLDQTGQILCLDIRAIRAGAREDLGLLWMPVLRRLAEWVVAWRRGNPGRGALRIIGRVGGDERTQRLREYLVDALRHEERHAALPPAALYLDA